MSTTRIINLKIEKLQKMVDNESTIIIRSPRKSSHQPVSFHEHFKENYSEIRRFCSSFDQQGLAIIIVDDRSIVAKACMAAYPNRINSMILGRHGMCEVYLSDPSLSLRHLSILLYPKTGSGIRFRLIDLRSLRGFSDEKGTPLSALEASGALFVQYGSYSMFLIPTGDNSLWKNSAELAWQNFPKRVYFRDPYQFHAQQESDDREVTAAVSLAGPQRVRRDRFGMKMVFGELSVFSEGRTCKIPISKKELEQGILLGRYDRCDGAEYNIIHANYISRVHLLIIQIANTLYAIDAASSNGTFENDQKVRVTELNQDKTLVLGSFGTMLRWKFT
ncbi:MAG: FHA domain-containing protein [Myxococcota bacterium]|nr:FHA domain-containing protein [Myxococcota bacterium]